MSSVIGLLNQVQNEEIVLPAIQRDFVWPEVRIVRLVDSILRGYPIGLVLLWETYSDLQYRPFVRDYRSAAPHMFRDNESSNKLKLVLDGQQRLQSLYVALYGTYEGKSLYFDTLSGFEVDDLSEDRFVIDFLKPQDAKKKNRLPREEIDEGIPFLYVKTADLFRMTSRERRDFERKATADLKLSEDERSLLEENLAKFEDEFTKGENILKVATIDENLVHDHPLRKSEADVCEIFVRINSEGTDLSRSDLIFSLLKLNWRESAEALPEFVRTINQGNSLGIGTDFVIRALFAVSDLGAKMDIDLLRTKSNVERLQTNFDKCCDAIRATVDFVQRHCRCSSSRLVGGLNTLVPFVYYFFHLPKHEIPNSQIGPTKRTLYLFAFTRALSRYGESRIGRFIRDELRPLANANDTTFPFQSAVSWMTYWEGISSLDLRLMERNVDLALHLVQGMSGDRVQYAKNAPEIDHIFPKSVLREKEYDNVLINTLANYWILAKGKNQNKSNRHPAKYFKDVDDAVLEEALIDRSLLDYRKYKKFIRERGASLEATIKARIGWSDDAFDSED